MSDEAESDDAGSGGRPDAEEEELRELVTQDLGSPDDEDLERRPWREGPDEDAAPESWLTLDDDELLHKVETLGVGEDQDARLLEVIGSDRHFFIRQEAAKRVMDRTRLFAFEDDRHVGQILVRHLTRREDLTYLERLAIRCRHAEVRSAAQVQLARVWRWLESPNTGSLAVDTIRMRALARAAASRSHPPAATPVAEGVPALDGVATTAVLAGDGVDASLLGWAAHFIVEHAWGSLGTTTTRELLRRTHRQLAPAHATLAWFGVNEDARVTTQVAPGARIPASAVRDVAAWMVAFREQGGRVTAEVHATSIRGCTALMADALREAGFYAACDEAEANPRA
jgi:hypothetical protein